LKQKKNSEVKDIEL